MLLVPDCVRMHGPGLNPGSRHTVVYPFFRMVSKWVPGDFKLWKPDVTLAFCPRVMGSLPSQGLRASVPERSTAATCSYSVCSQLYFTISFPLIYKVLMGKRPLPRKTRQLLHVGYHNFPFSYLQVPICQSAQGENEQLGKLCTDCLGWD